MPNPLCFVGEECFSSFAISISAPFQTCAVENQQFHLLKTICPSHPVQNLRSDFNILESKAIFTNLLNSDEDEYLRDEEPMTLYHREVRQWTINLYLSSV